MRHLLKAIRVLAVGLGGIGGVAPVGVVQAEVGTPAVLLSADGTSVVAGAGDAPIQLELFCDPQCPYCAKFETTYGDAIGAKLDSGELSMTYRWVTILDGKSGNDVSARVVRALVTAADPATPAAAYQAFVTDLYRNQDREGGGPTVAEVATMAQRSGVPAATVSLIREGAASGVDVGAVNAVNVAEVHRLLGETKVPTVYNLRTNTIVDIDDPNWLTALTPASTGATDDPEAAPDTAPGAAR